MKARLLWVGLACLVTSLSSCNQPKNYTNQVIFENTTLKQEKPIYNESVGRKFYISEDGNDENDGLSLDKPFASIDKVNSLKLIPGDSVLFKRGQKFVGKINLANLNGDDDNPITIGAYGEGSRPIITNGESTSSAKVIHIQQSSNVVIKDLEIAVCAGDRKIGSPMNLGINIYYRDCADKKYKNIFIDNNKIHAITPQNATFPVYDCNVAGIVLTSDEARYEVSQPETISNVHIINNEIYNMGRTGVYTTANNYTKSGENHHDVHVDKFLNVHIDNNYVHHVGTIGMYIKSGSYCSMNNNLIHDTGVSTDSTIMEGETGMMYICATNSEAKYNEVYNVFDQNTGYDAMGIDIDWQTYNIDIAYNYCHDCEGSGIGTMATSNSFIRNNKIENNLGNTTHNGSIVASNFIPPVHITGLVDEWLGVTNLKIKENLVIHNQEDKLLFRHKADNGKNYYSGNEFTKNHCVYTGEYAEDFQWMALDQPWSSFSENKYYSNDNSKFKSIDMTPLEDIENDAEPFVLTRDRKFSEWQKRDLNSTYELLNKTFEGEIYNPKCEFKDSKLALSWESSLKDVWHYNVHLISSTDDELKYTNMLEETKESNFEYTLEHKGNYVFAIQGESNVGSLSNVIYLVATVN